MRNTKEWQQEQARLDLVTAKLRAKLAELEPEADRLHDQAADIRKRFWEEVTVNTSTHEDFEESYFTIRQQAAVLSERESSHRLTMQRWNNMNRLLPSPYFGRIDFKEDGAGDTEQVYIGVSSFVDEENLSFLVYDWRTPMASMYYDHLPGPAAFEAPGGRITGEIELKRQYQIRGGELKQLFDASVTIGDELLQAVLGQGADGQMKSIVATIQREQNAIIRDDRSRMLIVQGAAGSGKTSAALQRVAYLLYKHRDRLKADQIVLFSPNPMYNSYVSTVLPELGEENMQQATFQEYLSHWLGSELRLEDPFDQLEYVLTGPESDGYEARLSGIRYKSSETYLQALQRYALSLGKAGMRFHAIRFRDRELISAGQMAARFYGSGGDSSVRLDNRVAELKEWLLRELTALERAERDADWVEEELDYLDNDQYADAYQALNREAAVFDFTEKLVDLYGELPARRQADDFDYAQEEEGLLRRSVVKAHFQALRRGVKRLTFIDMNGLYAQLFADAEACRAFADEAGLPAEWPAICAQTTAKLNALELFYEDTTPYLFLKELVEGVRTNGDVRHIFIDEGQDYSMFQYEFLKKLFPRARMTVLGDFGQAIFTQATDLSEANSPLLRLYDEADTTRFVLARSYRSTREIVAFTRAMLPDGDGIVPFERSGRKPALALTGGGEDRAARMAADVAALRAEGFASIAVITKTAAESEAAYAQLAAAGCGALRLVTKHTPAFEKGAMVMPAYLAKGVEFDAVLIYDASASTYGLPSERKLFYTACTRAMHRLLLYAAGDWSPFVQEVDASLYEIMQ